MTAVPRIQLKFDSREAMVLELQRNLRTGGAFCPGAAPLCERSACVLVLVHPDGAGVLELPAEVVYVKRDEPGKGVGVHMRDFNASVLEALTMFVLASGSAEPSRQQAAEDRPPGPMEQVNGQDETSEAAEPKQGVAGLQDRLKNLSVAAQQRLARDGSLTERVALERLYGKSVWEGLLHNPRVSPPEIARIARMGLASLAVLDFIVSNAAWLASGEVRRALLSNPRLSDEAITKVLRVAPKHEVQLIANQTAYHARVRRVAKQMTSRA